jgi:hypothetical protein
VNAILNVVERDREQLLKACMSILAIDEKTLEIADVACTESDLVVSLRDGRKIVTPLWWYPRLSNASPEQRAHWELAGAGRGIHWPDVDEDLSLEGILRAAKAPGAKPPA